MPRRKKELNPSPTDNKTNLLVARLQANSSSRDVYCAKNLMDQWRYIDFIDPRRNRPCISLEWLYGCRGLLAGRIIKSEAAYGVGKSSFMWLMYACAQRTSNAWCFHIESEAAPPPPDFIASFGCNTEHLIISQPRSLEFAFAEIDEVVGQIRGNPLNPDGKTQFKNPLDAELKFPIALGVDSISGLGTDNEVEEEVLDVSKSTGIGVHARYVSKWFRDRMGRLKHAQALLMMAAQYRSKVGGMPSFGGPKKTTLADNPIGFHATYVVQMRNSKFIDKKSGEDIGELVTLYTTKNKISPKHRELTIYLIRDSGFDLTHTDADFLLKHSASPLVGEATKSGQWIKCPMLSDKAFKHDEDFVDAFYANEDLVSACREKLRIRGFGFDFEKVYKPSESEIDDNIKSKESDIDGVEGTEGSV